MTAHPHPTTSVKTEPGAGRARRRAARATPRVSLIVTEMAVIEPTEAGLVLRERGPGVRVEDILAATGAQLLVKGLLVVVIVVALQLRDREVTR